MNIAPGNKQMPNCTKCGMQKLEMSDDKGARWGCPNCDVHGEGTGQTVLVSEPHGKDGPVKIQLVDKNAAPVPVVKQPEPVAKQAGVVLLRVPTILMPELVVWARKLKLPRDWSQAKKIKAITDFQVELNEKLEEMSK